MTNPNDDAELEAPDALRANLAVSNVASCPPGDLGARNTA